MSTNRHLHRTAVFATAFLVFAISATGTAFAWVRSDGANEARPTTISASAGQSVAAAAAAATFSGASLVVPTASPTAVKAPEAKITTTNVTAKAATASAAPVGSKVSSAKRLATTATSNAVAKSITIDHYVNKPGSQSAIDKCDLVLWTHSPLWLAGHNWCGYQWMAYVPTGTTVTVTHGLAAGTYVVTDHVRLSRQSGELPALNADLVLQTCIGNGTGLTLLKRA